MSQSLRVKRIHVALSIDSVAWRMLAYLRSINASSPWPARQLRRGALLLWWTATFQLHIHARLWVRARLRLRAKPVVAPGPVFAMVDPSTLVVPLSEAPVVSILVPTYGQLPFTLRCLASIAEHTGAIPIEVIVVDDAWPGTSELAAVSGIRLIRNDTNLGFLRSCNKAARLARGRYLCFLNNDTQVLDDWLRPMLSLFQERSEVGAVGAKLIYPDGRLQEAGGIIWRDGSGWNFGHREDPGAPVYNYVREVDYCSGAALLVDRGVFAGLGGFDERYAPAYFEDTDLCFRLRGIGLKTLYQPAARIIHHEGVSHGRDTAVGVKSCQVVNQLRFVDRWAAVLAREHYGNADQVMRARDRSMGRKVVLVVDHYVPMPDRDAGSRAITECMRGLLRAGFVVKFWPHNMAYSSGYTELLQGMGVEVFHGPEQAPFESWIKGAGGEFDTIVLSRPEVAEAVIATIRRHSPARIIYYGHDLHFRRMRQQAEVTGNKRILLLAEEMRRREQAIWQSADLSLYLSQEEAGMARALLPGAEIGAIVPYCFEQFGSAREAPASREIIFVAGFAHPPNEDAVVWFVSEILPLIRLNMPDARLSIIGSNPTPRVRGLAGEGIAVFGDVSACELDAAYDRARVAVVPLRCGAGVKLKVVEALRAGVPLVTTQVGAQGLTGLAEAAAVHDDPALFAAAVGGLLEYDDAWQSQSVRQIEFARTRFSQDAMTASLLAVFGPATRAF